MGAAHFSMVASFTAELLSIELDATIATAYSGEDRNAYGDRGILTLDTLVSTQGNVLTAVARAGQTGERRVVSRTINLRGLDLKAWRIVTLRELIERRYGDKAQSVIDAFEARFDVGLPFVA